MNKEKTEVASAPENGADETKETKLAETKELKSQIMIGDKGLAPKTFDEMWRIACCVVSAGICMKGHEKPEIVIIQMQVGFEHGMTMMQSIQNIYIVNNRSAIFGDAVPGLVEASRKQEYGYPTILGKRNADGSYPDDYGYKYTTKRKGRDEYSYIFTVRDAKKATLWGKAGTWTFYPDRMLLNRARTFCLRDVYPDVMQGLITTEEAEHIIDADYTIEDTRSRTEQLADIIAPQKKETASEPEIDLEIKDKSKVKKEKEKPEQTSLLADVGEPGGFTRAELEADLKE